MRRTPDFRTAGVGLLNTHLVTVQLQLIDHVRPGAGIRLASDRTTADRAGKHRDVSARVLFGKNAGVAAARRQRRKESEEK
jgi:hypothetical protein